MNLVVGSFTMMIAIVIMSIIMVCLPKLMHRSKKQGVLLKKICLKLDIDPNVATSGLSIRDRDFEIGERHRLRSQRSWPSTTGLSIHSFNFAGSFRADPPAIRRTPNMQDEASVPGSQDACVVCTSRKTRVTLQPCGHNCLCFECLNIIKGQTDKPCPVCRVKIESEVKTFRV